MLCTAFRVEDANEMPNNGGTQGLFVGPVNAYLQNVEDEPASVAYEAMRTSVLSATHGFVRLPRLDSGALPALVKAFTNVMWRTFDIVVTTTRSTSKEPPSVARKEARSKIDDC
ncbi:hypothetical protein PHSY_004901 [Pseudozyma hubeiensis SY62]|uniref:Uncharacterized protein n=1 Tax=Pseudozyma hubeiensis (strain SY62) TaxID=1305764 RepID=R9P7J8_PSEHS|nr:hypothetical protein PHSY_004901 [Pseudozyma hubeiensis SY62]GAC97316.1 hypothetical protein PHSY_004901 [Pseudozyma hubeiensis SY62]